MWHRWWWKCENDADDDVKCENDADGDTNDDDDAAAVDDEGYDDDDDVDIFINSMCIYNILSSSSSS